jgi:2-polyprenyl-3-methyl-5-hydroxy-6-metoxy-1,4-benzoquinol methylase
MPTIAETGSDRPRSARTRALANVDYAARCYESYWSNHMARFKTISANDLEYDMPLIRRSLRPFLPANSNAEILDIGCGYGALVHCLSQLGYTRVKGVDRCAEMAEVARSLGITSVQIGDFTEVLVRNPSRYELITGFDVIEHQRKQDVLPVLDAIYRALVPGGTVLIQTPNAMSHYGLGYRYGDFTHEVIFDAVSMRQVLGAAGFSDVRVLPVPPCARGLLSAIRRVLWAIREPWLKLLFAIEAGWTSGQVFTPNLLAAGYKPGALDAPTPELTNQSES